jgi:hypothetical protein
MNISVFMYIHIYLHARASIYTDICIYINGFIYIDFSLIDDPEKLLSDQVYTYVCTCINIAYFFMW